MTDIEKIVLIQSALGLNGSQFAKLAGISAPNYTQMKKGTRPAGEGVIYKMCARMNVTKEWFDGWDGSMDDAVLMRLQRRCGSAEVVARLDSVAPRMSRRVIGRKLLERAAMRMSGSRVPNAHAVENVGYMNVPFVPVRAQCGYLSGYGDPEYIGSLPSIPVIIDRTYHGKYRIFEAEGDSMDDNSRLSICDGDKVLAREIRRDLWLPKLHYNDWYFVIVHRTDGISIKQITAQDENGNITCHPLNPLFNDYVVNLDDVAELYNVVKVVERSMRL